MLSCHALCTPVILLFLACSFLKIGACKKNMESQKPGNALPSGTEVINRIRTCVVNGPWQDGVKWDSSILNRVISGTEQKILNSSNFKDKNS